MSVQILREDSRFDKHVNMDKIYKFTPSEYARLRGITTSAVRKRRLNGLEKNNFKEIGGKYFYKKPERDRPNIVEVTPHNNPKFNGSGYRPKKTLSQYYKKKKRRRNVEEGKENYHNARNGWQLKQLNDMRKLERLKGELSADGILELRDDIIDIAKARVADRKKEEAKVRASHMSAIRQHKDKAKSYVVWFNESNSGYNDATYHNGRSHEHTPSKFVATNRGKTETKKYYY